MEPGLFTEYPMSAVDATWYGEREGTDTVIVPKNEFSVGSVFLITVRCLNECSYDLRSFWSVEQDISNTKRKVHRWGGHSSAILSFYVPVFSNSGVTESVDIRIEPEGDYKYMEVYVSFGKRNS